MLITQGSRKPDGTHPLEPGDYCRWLDDKMGRWSMRVPSGHYGTLSPRLHTVTEHEDGTITVSPSILVTGHDGGWHGYLERGVWREC